MIATSLLFFILPQVLETMGSPCEGGAATSGVIIKPNCEIANVYGSLFELVAQIPPVLPLIGMIVGFALLAFTLTGESYGSFEWSRSRPAPLAKLETPATLTPLIESLEPEGILSEVDADSPGVLWGPDWEPSWVQPVRPMQPKGISLFPKSLPKKH